MEQLSAAPAQKIPSVNIEYIGNKEAKHDNINHTGIVWHGKGDVRPYPIDKAAALIKHKDIWRLAGAKTAAAARPLSAGEIEFESWKATMTHTGGQGGENAPLSHLPREEDSTSARQAILQDERPAGDKSVAARSLE